MFENISTKYINIDELKKIIYGILKLNSYNEVRKFINDKNVLLTKEEIINYLDKEYKKIHPKAKKNINSINICIEDIEKAKYKFEPYTLYYYKTYIDLLKKKLNKFLDIVDSISPNISVKELDVLNNYDIKINNQGLILKRDASRLICPILYCLSELLKKTQESNQLETYLNNKLNLDSIYRSGLNEADYYPSPELQVNSIIDNSSSEFISLTEKQKNIHMNKFKKNTRILNKMFDGIEERNKQRILL